MVYSTKIRKQAYLRIFVLDNWLYASITSVLTQYKLFDLGSYLRGPFIIFVCQKHKKKSYLPLSCPSACAIERELQARKRVSTTQRQIRSWLKATSRIFGRDKTTMDVTLPNTPKNAMMIEIMPPIHHFQSKYSCNDYNHIV